MGEREREGGAETAYICNNRGTKEENEHPVSFGTVWSQRTSSAKGGALPPGASRNEKESLTPHVPASHSAAPSPAAQSHSGQPGMHTCTAVSIHRPRNHATLTSRSSAAAVPRQAGKAAS